VEQAIRGDSPSHPDLQSTLEELPAPVPFQSTPILASNSPIALPNMDSNPTKSPSRSSPRLNLPPSLKQVAPFLLVDDNEVNLKLLSTYLSRKSYPILTATDGILAVDAYIARRGDFSAVFMDIQMPRMDGIAATRAIREYEDKEGLKACVVIALTGLATDEMQKEAEASGVNEFFAKPVRLKGLDDILERTARAVEDE
jgi:CheY-like chemotaxis protein